jgi:SAM-dependent methyltransferase
MPPGQGNTADFELRDEFGNADANLQFLQHAVALRPADRLLEIGSGRGALLHYLRQQGYQVRGVEINPSLIADSHRLYGDLPIVAVTGPTLPFADDAFEAVLSFDVFEHIRDSDAHLREVRRVLTPGGRYLLQTPNRWTNTIFETFRWRSFTSWRPDHCALHTYGQLRRRLERHGFAVRFHDVPVVTDFFVRKLRHYVGAPAPILLTLINPDKLPLRLRTNFYVEAIKRDGAPPR